MSNYIIKGNLILLLYADGYVWKKIPNSAAELKKLNLSRSESFQKFLYL